nr:reverse transcriptase domain-containing protein [Tanacetum cinerariifolium]
MDATGGSGRLSPGWLIVDDNGVVNMNDTMDNLEDRIANLEMVFAYLKNKKMLERQENKSNKESEDKQLALYKFNIDDHDHPIITTIEIPNGLNQGRNFLQSYGGRESSYDPIDFINSKEFTIYEMVNGVLCGRLDSRFNSKNPLWITHLVLLKKLIMLGEEDAFVVINLSEKFVKYNLISNINTKIFDIGSNQMDVDDDADDDSVLFIPPFEVDPNLYEFIPSLASPVEGGGSKGKDDREETPHPLTKEQIEGHVSALKSLIKSHNQRNNRDPIRLDFESEDTEVQDLGIAKGKEVMDEDLGKPFKKARRTPLTRQIIKFAGVEYKIPANIKLYDDTTDPEDHLSRFTSAANSGEWPMPVWCRMFQKTLDGSERGWFQRLPHDNINEWADLREAFAFRVAPVLTLKSLTKRPKEILAMETQLHLPAPLPMLNPLRLGNINQYCDYHQEKGHYTNDCIQLRKQLEMALESRKVNHLVKDVRQKGRRPHDREAPQPTKVINVISVNSVKDKKRKGREITKPWMNILISFPAISLEDVSEEPLIVEAKVEGYLVRRVYVDEGSSVEVIFKHCFENLDSRIKAKLKETQTDLVGFTGEISKPLGKIELEVCFGSGGMCRRTSMKFIVVQAPSPYNIILGRPGLKTLRDILSTIHSMMKFPTPKGVATLVTWTVIIAKCRHLEKKQMIEENSKGERVVATTEEVLVNPSFPDQRVTIGGGLSEACRDQIKYLLKDNMEVFAWEPSDTTGVPRRIIEHTPKQKNIFNGKKRGATYQRLVDSTFQCQIERNLEAYVDDIVIKSKDEKMFLADIAETFNNLKRINMKLNPKKCSFGVEEEKFLGYMTKEAEEAFQQMKKLIMDFPSLTPPWEKETLYAYLAVYAEAVSTVLLTDRKGRQCPVQYVSRTVNEAERNYAPMEKLTLSLIHMTRRPRRYFEAHPVKFITYHPIKNILNNTETSEKLAKYAVKLGAYNITFIPRNAVKGQVLADFLSKAPEGEKESYTFECQRCLWRKMTPRVGPYLLMGPLVRRDQGQKYESKGRCVKQARVDGIQSSDKGSIGRGPLSPAKGGAKFVIMAIDYFTKWKEAKPLVKTLAMSGSSPSKQTGRKGQQEFDGSEVVIPADIGIPTYRTLMIREGYNKEEMRLNLDLLQERRETTVVREARNKTKMEQYYNKKGKLGPKWEGPYRVVEAYENGSYKLQTLEDKEVPRTWHAINLRVGPLTIADLYPSNLYKCLKGSWAGLVLIRPIGIEYTYALRLTFLSTNNEAEYEALLVGLWIAWQINMSNIEVKVDSKLVASQINGYYEASKDSMIKYLVKAREYASDCKSFSIKNILMNM